MTQNSSETAIIPRLLRLHCSGCFHAPRRVASGNVNKTWQMTVDKWLLVAVDAFNKALVSYWGGLVESQWKKNRSQNTWHFHIYRKASLPTKPIQYDTIWSFREGSVCFAIYNNWPIGSPKGGKPTIIQQYSTNRWKFASIGSKYHKTMQNSWTMIAWL